ETRGCKTCGDKKEDTLYEQCDACDEWWHFSYAGITTSEESMQNCAWLCDGCMRKTLEEQPKLNEIRKQTTPGISDRDYIGIRETRGQGTEVYDSFSISPPLESFQPEESEVKHGEEEEPNLTSRQMAAWKAISKELPIFSGDPAEWPIFISHYEHTTRRCGYSNWENMLRLQKCLKGPALEMVRSRLLLPEVVSQVIEKLRSSYGRPVHLIKTLLEKVRRIPAPQIDKLESLNEYGEAVQCMVDHMKAAGQRAHITNPLLLEELVDKLPKDQQLLWSHHIRGMASVDRAVFREYIEELAGSLSARDQENLHVHAHVEPARAAASTSVDGRCPSCHITSHGLITRSKFYKLTVKERWQMARDLSVCFDCLEKHNCRACKNRVRCGING
uniref:PHD-type domain-containing protein n=1 Tax=Anopheles funestus TaxID=62324 RepID=A0A182RC36_ANOFN